MDSKTYRVTITKGGRVLHDGRQQADNPTAAVLKVIPTAIGLGKPKNLKRGFYDFPHTYFDSVTATQD